MMQKKAQFWMLILMVVSAADSPISAKGNAQGHVSRPR